MLRAMRKKKKGEDADPQARQRPTGFQINFVCRWKHSARMQNGGTSAARRRVSASRASTYLRLEMLPSTDEDKLTTSRSHHLLPIPLTVEWSATDGAGEPRITLGLDKNMVDPCPCTPSLSPPIIVHNAGTMISNDG